MMGAIVSMVADIDLKRITKQAVINLIRTEEKCQLGRCGGQLLDAAVMRVAQHQSTHARCGKMQDVKSVPAITHQFELFGQRQRSSMHACITQRAAANEKLTASGISHAA